MRVNECGEVRRGHDVSLAEVAILAGWGAGEFGEQPHAGERDTGAEAGGGFGDKTSAAGFEDAKDFGKDGLAVLYDEKKAGDDDGVDGVGRVAQSVDVAVGEGAVFEAAAGGPGFGSCDETSGEVYAGGADLRYSCESRQA